SSCSRKSCATDRAVRTDTVLVKRRADPLTEAGSNRESRLGANGFAVGARRTSRVARLGCGTPEGAQVDCGIAPVAARRDHVYAACGFHNANHLARTKRRRWRQQSESRYPWLSTVARLCAADATARARQSEPSTSGRGDDPRRARP